MLKKKEWGKTNAAPENSGKRTSARTSPHAPFVMAFFFSMLIFTSLAFAASVESITVSADVSSATTGNSIVITATPKADSGTATNVRVEVETVEGPSGATLSVSDPASPGYYTTSVSDSGTTKTFTVTAGTSGTYSYRVRATWDSGSTTSDTSSIEFESPSSLSVSGSPSAQTLANSGTYTLSISFTNPNAGTLATSWSLSLPSGITKDSGDPTSASVTLSGSATKSYSWVIKHSTCFTGSKTVTFVLGDNSQAFTSTVTSSETSCGGSSNTTSSSTSSSGGGGGGGGKGTGTGVSETQAVPGIAEGASLKVPFTKHEVAFTFIEIFAAKTIGGGSVTVTDVSKPINVPLPVNIETADVYKYLDVLHEGVSNENVSKAVMRFRVNKTWISDNNIDANTISLQRYTTTWTKFQTSYVSEDDEFKVYEAESPGLSIFAVTGEKSVVEEFIEQITEPVGEETPAAELPGANETAPEAPAELPPLPIAIVIVIIGVAVAAIFGWSYFHRHPHIWKASERKMQKEIRAKEGRKTNFRLGFDPEKIQ